ncbi:HAD family hydrolase [Actinocrispum wychmicini]|uniref:Putative hydrolase of the HAD superfamily n=1 Tax=Actinocrispum wychmicini TaxID=1213861 RepID=A0A4R2JK69_9PSEU|nr:HAD family phosphatase [Actinocrispum wychmicini]TCO59544.1 putative hydrolase of the HAD superfamily [Actinocrispum wychmicini]
MNRPAILIDIGGVLVPDHPSTAATEWSTRLGISPPAFLAALYGGNDDQVLIGRTSEESWWSIVGNRLGIDRDLIATIRSDLTARQTWDDTLVAGLRGLRGCAKTAIVSNTWPHMRTTMANAGLLDMVDAIVLSCEVGFAKPDPRIYTTALQRVSARPADTLFIDDTPGHVATARSLGMTGHVHTNTRDTLTRIQEFLPSS